jgi:uncharacterized protein YjbI with pentapeptide repeats
MARNPAPAQPPDAPDIPSELESTALDEQALQDGTRWAGVRVADAALAGARARGVSFVEARIERADLSGAQLANLRLADCELDACNLANLRAIGASMRRVVVSAGRLTGLAWTEGGVEDAAFRDCRIDLASFGRTRFAGTAFEDCVLTDADFQEARLRSVRFERCDLTGADFSDARFERCELRGCTLDRVRGLANLRGVAMPRADVVAAAATFAAALGIEILDE